MNINRGTKNELANTTFTKKKEEYGMQHKTIRKSSTEHANLPQPDEYESQEYARRHWTAHP